MCSRIPEARVTPVHAWVFEPTSECPVILANQGPKGLGFSLAIAADGLTANGSGKAATVGISGNAHIDLAGP